MANLEYSLDSIEGIANQVSASVTAYVASAEKFSHDALKARTDLFQTVRALAWHTGDLASNSTSLMSQLVDSESARGDVEVFIKLQGSVSIITTNLAGLVRALWSLTRIVRDMIDTRSVVPWERVLSLPLWANMAKGSWDKVTNEMQIHGTPYTLVPYPRPDGRQLLELKRP